MYYCIYTFFCFCVFVILVRLNNVLNFIQFDAQLSPVDVFNS